MQHIIMQRFICIFCTIDAENFKVDLQSDLISHKRPLLVLWLPFFPPLCPPVAGPCILTIACFDRSSPLQTVRVLLDSRTPPYKCAEPRFRNPIKALGQ